MDICFLLRSLTLMREDKKTVTATTAATAATATPTGYWYYVGLYLMFNLALTLFNKAVLDDLPYPYTLTAVHAASNVIGCTIARLYGLYVGVCLQFRPAAHPAPRRQRNSQQRKL